MYPGSECNLATVRTRAAIAARKRVPPCAGLATPPRNMLRGEIRNSHPKSAAPPQVAPLRAGVVQLPDRKILIVHTAFLPLPSLAVAVMMTVPFLRAVIVPSFPLAIFGLDDFQISVTE